ncbi:sensor histidine kinase [Lachnoclostridium phytofermentans]|uniref:histidine kinase n=1 Tax=Lachnoclostridium phytofermentans (strain ATCC 700394 / DSM 18823 / ISDg) TaxID=357809 RepID=A9KNL9_LACP7|nr:HAMP domain-containing sensor histidine kinase [Lachnoclostridium phytofermentans]ABX41620.1 integral membrane sensor signal transduction histidine kinase [Lachnoclostridium phytofermentans ISDg]
MFIAKYFITIFIWSMVYVILSQYLLFDMFILIYIAGVLIISLFFMFLLHTQKEKLRHSLSDIFDKSWYDYNYSEQEASIFEYKFYQFIQSNITITKSIQKEKEQIHSLITDISHQIKTPLSNIILYADLLQEEYNDERINNISSEGEKLKFLFDAMIKMSRCESGLILENLQRKENYIKELLTNAVSSIYKDAEQKNLDIQIDCNSNIKAFFDMKWTTEAISNILDNAVKYSSVGSNIEITVNDYNLYIEIEITDHGIGIEEHEQQNIWRRFYRSDSVKELQGVGIGLYLTSNIILNQKGYLKVKSKLGEGSTFSVFLSKLKSDECISSPI